MSAYLAPPFFVLALAASVSARLMPTERGPVAVLATVADGGARAIAIVAAAGGRVIEVRGGSLVVAQSDELGFVGRLYRAGALVVASVDSSPCGTVNQAKDL